MISLIWATTNDKVIGLNNNLPWHYQEDLKYFKEKTLNHTVIMGYNTYLSIVNRIGKALPNRTNIVINFDKVENVETLTSIEEVVNLYQNTDEEVFIIGGASIYKQLYPHAKRLYVTLINKEYPGDTFFDYDLTDFELVSNTKGNDPDLNFLVYERKSKC